MNDNEVPEAEKPLPVSPESASPEQTDAAKTLWISRALSAIQTREQEFDKGWWRQAKDAEKIYTADSEQNQIENPFNILYSNTEVLLPSLYSATPKPDIRSRYRENQIKPIPEILTRFLTVAADPASPGADTFDLSMRDAVLSALVPGMGYVRIRYLEDKSFPLNYESGHYTTLVWGKASRWSKVPWIAFKHPMKRQQMFKQFNIPLDQQSGYSPTDATEDNADDCIVWELWDKASRKVYFLSDSWREKLLTEAEDPLNLENFYPTPGLLMLTVRGGKFLPIPLYNYYKEQAEELNRVSVRLNRVISAIRVRGLYNGMLGEDLKKLLASDELDNQMIAAGEGALLSQSGGLDKHIWMMPTDKLMVTAQELYKAREACKQVIYELTGISDIIRGSSVASETATAQDLKNKWGTVRLRRMQTVVADYARDLFRMSVDCAADKIPAEKWALIVQMPEVPTQQQQELARQQIQHAQMLAQLQPPAPQVPGQPPAPAGPPVDPKLQALASAPTWESILGKIKDDMNRTFIVNIQTSSTVDLDTAQDKAEVTEFMNAMGQLMAPLGGLAQLGPTGLEAAKAILQSVCLRFKFGIDIADVIEKIQPPPPPAQEAPPPGPSPEELAANKAEQEMRMQKIQGDMQVNAGKVQLELAKLDAAKQELSISVELSSLRLQEQRAKLAAQSARPPAKPAARPSPAQ